MKKIIIFFLLIITTALNAQNFEGTLIYSVDVEPSQRSLDANGMTIDEWKSIGYKVDTVKVFYKNGFYKSLTIPANAENSWVIYRPDSNKLYSFIDGEGSDICFVNDAYVDKFAIRSGSLPTIKLLDTIVKFREYDLKMVMVKWDLVTCFYLYSEDHFKTNPNLYRGHLRGGFYEFLKISGSLPIKIIYYYEGLGTNTESLIEFNEGKLTDELFQIPELVEDEELNLYEKPEFGKVMKIKK